MKNIKYKIIIYFTVLLVSFFVFKFIFENTMDGKTLDNQKIKTFQLFDNKYDVSNLLNWKLFSGSIELYYKDSHKIKGRSYYTSGKLNGVRTMWYENGEIEYKVPFVNGKVHGILYKWNKNGILYLKANYIDGERDGNSYLLHNDKKMIEVLLYKKSKYIGHRFIDVNGTVMKNIRK